MTHEYLNFGAFSIAPHWNGAQALPASGINPALIEEITVEDHSFPYMYALTHDEELAENTKAQLKALNTKLSIALFRSIEMKKNENDSEYKEHFISSLKSSLYNPSKNFGQFIEFAGELPKALNDEDKHSLENLALAMTTTYSYGKNLKEKKGKNGNHPFVAVSDDYEKSRLDLIADARKILEDPKKAKVFYQLALIEQNKQEAFVGPSADRKPKEGAEMSFPKLSMIAA
jgi:hypothetical protein